MKALCAALLLAAPALAHAQDAGPLKATLIAEVDAFLHAWERQDASALTAALAPEFRYVTSRGVSPRESVVGALTHACTLTNYRLSDVELIPISADSAALVYKLHQAASCAGHADPPVVLNTDTLVRREGKWRFLLTTSTPAE